MAFMDSARYRWSASSMLRNFVQYYSDASTSFGGSAGGTNAAYPMSKALNARFEALNSNPTLSANCLFANSPDQPKTLWKTAKYSLELALRCS